MRPDGSETDCSTAAGPVVERGQPVDWGLRAAARREWLVVPIILAIGCGLSALVDRAVAEFCQSPTIPQFVREAAENFEPFGHGVGVTVIIIATCLIDRARLRGWWILATVVLAGGQGANLVKTIIYRTRPRDWTVDPTSSGYAAFETFFQTGHSFPSAHTATATALAVVLSRWYPHASSLFFVLAALVGFQRVVSGAHFPSDAFGGALVGWLAAHTALATIRCWWQPKTGADFVAHTSAPG